MIETETKIENKEDISVQFQHIIDRFNSESQKEVPYIPISENIEPVRQLAAEIERYSLLTQEETNVLCMYKDKADNSSQELIKGDGNLNTETKSQLIKDIQDGIEAKKILSVLNIPLVISIAMGYRGKIAVADLISAGYVGLRRSIDKYDYKLGYKFSTYATWWIKQSIRRTIINEVNPIRLPNHRYLELSRYEKERERLKQELKREPSDDELCKDLEITHDILNNIRDAKFAYVSMDTEVEDDQNPIVETIPDTEEDVKVQVEKKIISEEVKEYVKYLKPDEQKIINLRFGLEDGNAKSINEVADILGRTRQAIEQREFKILRKLRGIVKR
jgi:RNA polymerase primary sigma factor